MIAGFAANSTFEPLRCGVAATPPQRSGSLRTWSSSPQNTARFFFMNSDEPSRILIVDDDVAVRRLLKTVLQHYVSEEVGTGSEALGMLRGFRPDLVLLDIGMPGMDGYETCRCIKTDEAVSSAQVVMISARSSREEQLHAYECGADDYIIKPFDPQDLLSRVRLHLQLHQAKTRVAAIQDEIQAHNAELKAIAERRLEEIIATQDVALFMLAKVAESRDQDTAGHLTRMRAYSQILAEHLARRGPYASQLNRRLLDDLYRSSPLHDIGKVGICDEILLKPGRLTPDEFEIMKRHTIIGANLLDEAVAWSQGGGFLAMAAMIARFHHERFDGTGYPTGLAGHQIPLPARIVALADVYDALTSVRPYKPAYSPSHARGLILGAKGQHFDPVIVDAFQECFPAFLAVQKKAPEQFATTRGAMAFREYEWIEALAADEHHESADGTEDTPPCRA